MAAAKIAITIEESLLKRLDLLIREHRFPNRSKAVQAAIQDKLDSLQKNRLEIECAKLNPEFEQALADERISSEVDEWPKY